MISMKIEKFFQTQISDGQSVRPLIEQWGGGEEISIPSFHNIALKSFPPFWAQFPRFWKESGYSRIWKIKSFITLTTGRPLPPH